jgi:hypothetical protein
MSSYLVDPGTYLPKVAEMTDFNMWTWNARVFPGIDPLPVRLGDRVRVRTGNLTMTNHPIHLHGFNFTVTGTDGGWIPESARWPETTTDVSVGAIRAFEVDADAASDWAPLPQVSSHHERYGPQHQEPDWHQSAGACQGPQDHSGLPSHGSGRHGRHGVDGDADAREHAADDDRLRTIRVA